MPPKKKRRFPNRAREQAEVQAAGAEGEDKTCFLAVQSLKRKKRNLAYHYVYDEESVANIPDLIIGEKCEDEERESLITAPPLEHQVVTDEDISLLKQELNQLSFEIILQILYSNEYDVQKTLEDARDLVVPDMVPQTVKDFFIANIAYERLARPTRGKKYKAFYFAREFRGIVDTKYLVDFYYREKNRIGNNWRQDRPDQPLTEEQQVELAKKMKTCKISLINCDVINSPAALQILNKEEITSENSETDEKPVVPTDSARLSPSPRPIFRQRDTTSQPRSPCIAGTSSSSPSIMKPVTRRSGGGVSN